MADTGHLAHPVFEIDELPRTSFEDRFRIRLTSSRTHYYIAISSTVLAVWRGEAGTPVLNVVRRVADQLNLLRGDPSPYQDNYRFTEANTQDNSDPPHIEALSDIIAGMPAPGTYPSQYVDNREGIYD